MGYRIFLSYKYTGVDTVELQYTIRAIEELLLQQGHHVFCSLSYEHIFRNQGMNYDEILDFCIHRQQESDIFLAFLNYEEPSNGMKKELQQAIKLGQTIIVCIRHGLSYDEFRSAAHRLIEFPTYTTLLLLLKDMKL